MNSPHLPPEQPPDLPTPSRPTSEGLRSGCGTVLLGLLGFVLILPGLCSIPFTFAMSTSGIMSWRDVPAFVLVGIPIALLFFLGVKLILRAFR